MKNRKNSIAVVIFAVVMIMALLVGCGAENKVEATISSFENACRSLDVRGMLECINPAVSQPLLNALDMFGMEDTSGTLEQITAWMDLVDNSGQTTEEYVQSIHIEPKEYAFNEDKDRCTVTVELSCIDSESEIVQLLMILKDGEWYISSFNF